VSLDVISAALATGEIRNNEEAKSNSFFI